MATAVDDDDGSDVESQLVVERCILLTSLHDNTNGGCRLLQRRLIGLQDWIRIHSYRMLTRHY